MNKKKITILVCALFMMLSLGACGKVKEDEFTVTQQVSDGTLWEGQIALYFRWTCLPDGAVPELAAGFSRNDRRLS